MLTFDSSFVSVYLQTTKYHVYRVISFFPDPFADANQLDDKGLQDGLIHIRIQQRNGRKTLTTVQGIADSYDKKKIVKACKKVIITLQLLVLIHHHVLDCAVLNMRRHFWMITETFLTLNSNLALSRIFWLLCIQSLTS